jgi:hypothetical protein
VGWLLVELVIVFVGVYAAFVLDDHRDQRRIERKRRQVYAALLQEFRSHAASLDTVVLVLDTMATGFADDHEAGSMPRPGPIHLLLGIRSGLWEATLEAGGLDVIDVDLMYRINTYYSLAEFIAREMERLTDLSDRFVLPNADGGLETFYDIETQKLRKSYRWYLDGLVAIRDHMRILSEMTDDLVATLEQRSGSDTAGL